MAISVKALGAASSLTLACLTLAACSDPIDIPPLEAEQYGFRGVGMERVINPRYEAILQELNQVPPPLYDPVEPYEGQVLSKDFYENVQVLGNLSTDEFGRLMAHITEWVVPADAPESEAGCNYCHNPNNLAEDSKYTKLVARSMLLMTMDLNTNWKSHVGGVGVTCYTCHRGNAVPANYWYTQPADEPGGSTLGYRANLQNQPQPHLNYTSLPADPFTPYLLGAEEIRRASDKALPTDDRSPDRLLVKATESTYALMVHMSQGLGVGCTYCHNTRAFASWEESPPTRATAWYGIRMARSANQSWMTPLQTVFPDYRKGPEGDVFKINCATCHNGVNKPLYGVPMLQDHPELWGGADYEDIVSSDAINMQMMDKADDMTEASDME